MLTDSSQVFSHVVGGKILENWAINQVHDSFDFGDGTTSVLVAGNVTQGSTLSRYGFYLHNCVYCSFNANGSDIHQTGWYSTNVSNINFNGNGAEAFTEDGMSFVNARNISLANMYVQGTAGANGCRSGLRIDGGFGISIDGLRAEIPIGGPQLGEAIDLTNNISGNMPFFVSSRGQINFGLWGNGKPNRPDLLVRDAHEDRTMQSKYGKHDELHLTMEVTEPLGGNIVMRNNGAYYMSLSNCFGVLIGSATNQYALLQLDALDTFAKDIIYQSGGISRWFVRSTGPEGGGNSGSDFSIIRVDDAGVNFTNAFYINRSSGFVALGNSSAPGWQLDVFGDIRGRTNLYVANQVGIGTTLPDASAALQIDSTTQGLLFPRMSTAQRNAIAAPLDGLIIYNNIVPEFQQRVAGAWLPIGSSSAAGTVTNFSVGVFTNLMTVTSPTTFPLLNVVDPGAHRIWMWDDTDNRPVQATVGSGLSYDNATHTLSATNAGATLTAYQEAGTGTDFNYITATDLYQKISFGTTGPSFVITNAGTYQITLTAACFDAATFQQTMYLTNVTDAVLVAGPYRASCTSPNDEFWPVVFNRQVTTSGSNRSFELWGKTANTTYSDAGLKPAQTVLTVIKLN